MPTGEVFILLNSHEVFGIQYMEVSQYSFCETITVKSVFTGRNSLSKFILNMNGVRTVHLWVELSIFRLSPSGEHVWVHLRFQPRVEDFSTEGRREK